MSHRDYLVQLATDLHITADELYKHLPEEIAERPKWLSLMGELVGIAASILRNTDEDFPPQNTQNSTTASRFAGKVKSHAARARSRARRRDQ
jgi:hypothetical protein